MRPRRRASAVPASPRSPAGAVAGAPDRALGRPRLHLRRVDSTNERARALALAGAPHGTLVTADFQTAGRGRQGRRWLAQPGCALLASLIVRSPPPLLPLVAAVAVCDVAGRDAQIKWPNDVVRARAAGAGPTEPALAKLAGILVEARPQQQWAVLGIGLNVAIDLHELPRELRARVASLDQPPDQIEPTLTRLLAALARRLAAPTESVLDAWRARDALQGRPISWQPAPAARPAVAAGPRQHGRALGIDGAGRLVVALDGGARATLDAGEVQLGAIG
jgi:BirA family transcriptional regulator, biotin operon repressor / biotin---[acetyl-CoA-carboxylase] ligase